MSERKRTTPPLAASDFGPAERYRRREPIAIEPAGRNGAVRARVVAENALDWYFRRRHLDPSDTGNNRLLYESGMRLRADWTLAGLEPDVTAGYSDLPSVRRVERFMAAREDAYRRWRDAIAAVGPVAANEVIEVCCAENRVGRVGLEILRRGLRELARHYSKEKRSPRIPAPGGETGQPHKYENQEDHYDDS